MPLPVLTQVIFWPVRSPVSLIHLLISWSWLVHSLLSSPPPSLCSKGDGSAQLLFTVSHVSSSQSPFTQVSELGWVIDPWVPQCSDPGTDALSAFSPQCPLLSFSPVESQGIWITHSISSTVLSSGATLEETSETGMQESHPTTMSLKQLGRSWTEKNPVNTHYLNCVEGNHWLQYPEEDLSMAPGMFVMHELHKEDGYSRYSETGVHCHLWSLFSLVSDYKTAIRQVWNRSMPWA